MTRRCYVLFPAFLLLLGCQQFEPLGELDQARSTAEYAVPLIDTRTTVRELLDNVEEVSDIVIDADGLIHFIYRGDVVSQTSDDLFASINESLPPVIPVASPRMALPFATPDGLQIDRVDLRDGQLIYFMENKRAEPLDVRITFPQVIKDGKALSFRQYMPAYSGTGTPPQATNFFAPAGLSGYSIFAERDSIYVEYEALRSDGRPDTLSTLLLRIQNLGFAYAEGYFGNQVHPGNRDTIQIDFFDNWVRGDVYFEEPRITFFVDNAFGVPTRSVVNLFNVITVRGEVLPLESEFVTNGIDFPFPSFDEVGKVKSSAFTFTKDNSNIDVLLGSGPVAVDYDVDALTNPDNDPGIRGFITDSSFYRVRVEVELPLFGRATDFLALDTFDISLSQFDSVDYAEFKLVADNEMPMGVDLQAYFLDEGGVVLDSLLDAPQRLVAAAAVDERGIAVEPSRKITYAPFPAERFDRIRYARYLALQAAFSTTGDGAVSVRPLAEQELHVRIGAVLGISRE